MLKTEKIKSYMIDQIARDINAHIVGVGQIERIEKRVFFEKRRDSFTCHHERRHAEKVVGQFADFGVFLGTKRHELTDFRRFVFFVSLLD